MDDGGFNSSNEQDGETQELYFIGIIDILTPFNTKKRTESFFKRIVQDKYGVSAVKPSFYGQRFFNFMRTLTINNAIPNTTPEFPPLPMLESKLKQEKDQPQPLSLVQAFQKSTHHSSYQQPRKNKIKSDATSLNKSIEPILEKQIVSSPTEDIKLEVVVSQEAINITTTTTNV